MLRLDKIIKPWKESAALNDHVNLYGFWNETVFLTKSGDVSTVLSIPGVDYESLDRSEQEYAVKRLEAALKVFGPGFHVYQYLFKSNRPDIPFATYGDPVVDAAIDQRRRFFDAKRDHLYQVEIFHCILLEGARSKTGVGAALARLFRDPAGAVGELKAQFINDSMKALLRTHIEHDVRRLDQQVQAFVRQLADFMQVEVLHQQGQLAFFRRLLNYDDWRVSGRPQSTQFLDYQVVNSDIEAERDHLRVGDHIVRVLTMKEAITETKPLVLDALLKIPANFYVVTEWTPLPADKARKEVNNRRRHFNMSKTGFVSQMGNDAAKTNPRVSTSPGWMTKSPSGLRQSEAIFASNLLAATPAEAVRCTSWRICSRIADATRVAVGKPVLFSVTSRYASSNDSGSTRSVCRLKISDATRDSPISYEIWWEKDSIGTQAFRRTAGMAERTPNRLASYEAAQTTERLPRQATITGLPRNCGSSRCSTEA